MPNILPDAIMPDSFASSRYGTYYFIILRPFILDQATTLTPTATTRMSQLLNVAAGQGSSFHNGQKDMN
jgi:hypothetical protein